MKCVKTQDAVGHVLCHDITQIIKDVKKGTAFRKGHIVTEEDIPVLLSLGKDNLYIWEKTEGILHENEAAEYLRDICMNENMIQSEVKEGKIELIAEIDGLLKIDVDKLRAVNSLGEMMIATRHTNTTVKKGDKLVGTRIIPLLIEQEKMEKAKEVAGDRPILSLIPFKKKKVGIVTTGNEVFYGRIKDTFGPVVAEKVKEFGADVIGQTIVNDDMEKITKAVEEFIEQGADMVLCTGGMSVDPDDKTPGAIKNTGARIVSYGAPVLPGAMMLLAYYEKDGRELPIVGLPGCVMYAKRTVFDLVLPRLMASLTVDSERVYKMSGKLNHFDQHGNAVMVDVTDKNVTEREAVATGKIFVCDETYERILTGNMAKGDVLAVARVAGIMATKKTSELIPMCHPLMLTKAKVDFEFNEEEKSISATCLVKLSGKTGVEMEALTGVNVALLTIYDMCKAIDKGMVISDVHLVKKSGGKSGDFYFNEEK